jgi:hypothetical protein
VNAGKATQVSPRDAHIPVWNCRGLRSTENPDEIAFAIAFERLWIDAGALPRRCGIANCKTHSSLALYTFLSRNRAQSRTTVHLRPIDYQAYYTKRGYVDYNSKQLPPSWSLGRIAPTRRGVRRLYLLTSTVCKLPQMQSNSSMYSGCHTIGERTDEYRWAARRDTCDTR